MSTATVNAQIAQLTQFLVDRASEAGEIFDGDRSPTFQLNEEQQVQAVVNAHNQITRQTQGSVKVASLKDSTDFPKTIDIINGTQEFSDLSTSFSNVEQALSYIDSLAPEDPNLANDLDLPQTQEQKRKIVSVLKRAVCSTVGVGDNVTGKATKKLFEGQLDPRIIEVACWQMLDYTIMRAKRGRIMPMWGQRRQRARTGNPSFAQLIDDLVTALSTQKAVAKNAIDPSYLAKLVDDPAGRLKQSQSSQVANTGRQRNLMDRRGVQGGDEGSKNTPVTPVEPTDNDNGPVDGPLDDDNELRVNRPRTKTTPKPGRTPSSFFPPQGGFPGFEVLPNSPVPQTFAEDPTDGGLMQPPFYDPNYPVNDFLNQPPAQYETYTSQYPDLPRTTETNEGYFPPTAEAISTSTPAQTLPGRGTTGAAHSQTPSIRRSSARRTAGDARPARRNRGGGLGIGQLMGLGNGAGSSRADITHIGWETVEGEDAIEDVEDDGLVGEY